VAFKKIDHLGCTCSRDKRQSIVQALDGPLEERNLGANITQLRMADFESFCKLFEKYVVPVICITAKQNVIHVHHDCTVIIFCNAGRSMQNLKSML
jgi:hypothetical protein